MTIHISLLGTPHIEIEGVALDFGRKKALALIAYLAITQERHYRDAIAALLWADLDEVRSRAALRRTLAAINETPMRGYIDADREMIGLVRGDDLEIDTDRFAALLNGDLTIEALEEAVTLYRDRFMVGFSLEESGEFDEWMSLHTQHFHDLYTDALGQLVIRLRDAREIERALHVAQRWTAVDPLNEAAQRERIRLYAMMGQRGAAIAAFGSFAALLKRELDITPEAETLKLIDTIRNEWFEMGGGRAAPVYVGLPPLPPLVIGRESVIDELRVWLTPSSDGAPIVVVQGWPGIGKTTLTAQIAHDLELRQTYPDGVLYASLGGQPNLAAALVGWGRALGISGIDALDKVEDLSARVTSALQDRRILLVVDDVWQIEHAMPFRIAGRWGAVLFTTRFNDLARALSPRADSVYKVPVLSDEHGVTLLRTLAPDAVAAHPDESRELAHDLEGLPLALQVAGRLLNAEYAMGWGIRDLLEELQQGVGLLGAEAPADRYEIATQTTPTIAALLQRSVERLSASLQEQFAMLGVFAPKPATFTLAALGAVWETDDTRSAAAALVDRGLLEPVGGGVFQMHALLVMQARRLFGAS